MLLLIPCLFCVVKKIYLFCQCESLQTAQLFVTIQVYLCVSDFQVFVCVESSCFVLLMRCTRYNFHDNWKFLLASQSGKPFIENVFLFFFRVVLDAFQMHYCTIFELYFRFFETSFTLKKKVYLTFWSQK